MAVSPDMEAEIKKLYDPDFFYNHGDNPAHKKFMELASADTYGVNMPEFRSHIFDNKARWFLTRNFDDFMQRDMKVWTAPRALGALFVATAGFLSVVGFSRKMLPVGHFGIRNLSQTPFFHKFGRFPTYAVAAIPFIAFYGWFRISSYCARRLWNNVVLQEREWAWEQERRPYYGKYYFEDAPLSAQENFPKIARVEIARGKSLPTPEWAK